MKIIKTSDTKIPADELIEKINSELLMGKKVLWLVAGGSSMSVAVIASKSILPNPLLKILLTDERYGMPGDKDSNEEQLKNLGFFLPISPVLYGNSKEETVEQFSRSVEESLNNSDVIVALFGVGADGHVAGIMPSSIATLPETDYCVGYQAPNFYRLTITPKVIREIDSAYLWMQGENKKEAFERLMIDYPKDLQPGQYLKEASEFNIYTDI